MKKIVFSVAVCFVVLFSACVLSACSVAVDNGFQVALIQGNQDDQGNGRRPQDDQGNGRRPQDDQGEDDQGNPGKDPQGEPKDNPQGEPKDNPQDEPKGKPQDKPQEKAPNTITTADELARFAWEVNNGDDKRGMTYKLGNDIDLNVAPFNTGAGWIPIGRWTPVQSERHFFNGIFDGAGYKITGLYINNRNINDRVGLFSMVESDAVIKNLGVTGVNITGNLYVGGIASVMGGTMINCYTTGVIRGVSQVGGLAGHGSGSIINSFSSVDISYFDDNFNTGGNWMGGIVGFFNGIEISGCSFSGTIDGRALIGGIAGFARGVVRYCSFSGSINGNRAIGGIVGDTFICTVISCVTTGTINGVISDIIVGDLRSSTII